MSFTFNKCFTKDNIEIKGLFEISPKVFGDNRGYFMESYNKKDFSNAGLSMNFVQDNQSKSIKGVLRGLHFQTLHPQGKLIRVLDGCIYDVVVDLRKGSTTYAKYYGIILDSNKNNQLYIPKGFAHGFYVLSDTAITSYKCTDFYDPKGENGIIWNDRTINIDWASNIKDTNPIFSDKDTKHPSFDINKDYFDIDGKWIGE